MDDVKICFLLFLLSYLRHIDYYFPLFYVYFEWLHK